MPFLNYNGLLFSDDEALVTPKNKSFRLGEGLIETMLWNNKSIRLFSLHIERLTESLYTLGFPALNEEEFLHNIHKTISANDNPEKAIVRAQFFNNAEDNALHYIIEAVFF